MVAQAGSHFLRLPGEIRNRIYGYLTTRPTRRDFDLSRQVTTRNRPGTKFASDLIQTKDKWSEFMESVGLAQSCQQFRKEYLPLHLDRVRCFNVMGHEMHEFVQTFGTSAITTLVPVVFNFEYTETGQIFELWPRLKMALKTHVGIHHMSEKHLVKLNASLRHPLNTIKDVEAFRAFIRDSVSSITYQVGHDESLRVMVKQSAKKEWMPWDPEVDAETRPRKYRAAAALWRFRMGFGHIQMPKVEIAED